MIEELLKGKWLGHPLHPALAHVPAGLWPAAFFMDLISFAGMGGNVLVRMAFYAILIGLIGAILAVPAGVMDWGEIKKERPAWKLGLYHMMLNLLATILWAVNLGFRIGDFREAASVSGGILLLSALAFIISLAGVYLGGRMVFDQGTSVGRLSRKKWRKIAADGNAVLPPEKD
jgi:uncharacterized membrane protein